MRRAGAPEPRRRVSDSSPLLARQTTPTTKPLLNSTRQRASLERVTAPVHWGLMRATQRALALQVLEQRSNEAQSHAWYEFSAARISLFLSRPTKVWSELRLAGGAWAWPRRWRVARRWCCLTTGRLWSSRRTTSRTNSPRSGARLALSGREREGGGELVDSHGRSKGRCVRSSRV